MIDPLCFELQYYTSFGLWGLWTGLRTEPSVEVTPCLATISCHCLSNVTLRNTPCKSMENTCSWVSVCVRIAIGWQTRFFATRLLRLMLDMYTPFCELRIKMENKGKHNILLTNPTKSFCDKCVDNYHVTHSAMGVCLAVFPFQMLNLCFYKSCHDLSPFPHLTVWQIWKEKQRLNIWLCHCERRV